MGLVVEQLQDEVMALAGAKWEYYILEIPYSVWDVELNMELDELGSEGWELVSTIAPNHYIFKRRVEE